MVPARCTATSQRGRGGVAAASRRRGHGAVERNFGDIRTGRFPAQAPTVSQVAAAAAFDDVDATLEGHVAVYKENRGVVLAALNEMGVDPNHVAPCGGAFYVYADLGAFGVDDAPGLCHRLLADEGVAITPGVDFEFDEAVGKRRIRISYCGAPAQVAEAMERLKRWWAAGKYKS